MVKSLRLLVLILALLAALALTANADNSVQCIDGNSPGTVDCED